MPLYEYQCTNCGYRFEKIRKFSDPPLETCPKCGGKVEKLLSSPAFQFKGSGFYVTDYVRKGDAEKDEGKSSSKSEGSDSASSTAKPAGESSSSSSSSSSGDTGSKESKPAAPTKPTKSD